MRQRAIPRRARDANDKNTHRTSQAQDARVVDLGLSNLAERFLLRRYEALVEPAGKIELAEIARWRKRRRRRPRVRGGVPSPQ